MLLLLMKRTIQRRAKTNVEGERIVEASLWMGKTGWEGVQYTNRRWGRAEAWATLAVNKLGSHMCGSRCQWWVEVVEGIWKVLF